MLDIRLLRTDPELVKENIRKKFQDEKLVLVDEVVAMDRECREAKTRCDELRNRRNVISKQIGQMMKGASGRGATGQAERGGHGAGAGGAGGAHRRADRGNSKAHAGHPQHHRPLGAHRQGRQRKCGSGALWRAGRAAV